jgi:hypothetical protein
LNVDMEEKQLVDRAINYLRSRGTSFPEESVAYRGIMKDVEMLDGSRRDMQMIGFLSYFDKASEMGRLCYILANTQTGALEFLFTPHTMEQIYEDL